MEPLSLLGPYLCKFTCDTSKFKDDKNIHNVAPDKGLRGDIPTIFFLFLHKNIHVPL